MSNTALATTNKDPIYISNMAPKGVDGRVWAKVLKEQLLASKDGEPTDEELLYFAQVCQSTGLDPTKREIYGIYRNVKQKDGSYKQRLSIQTGIDGFRRTAEESGKYAGSKEPEFIYDPNIVIGVNVDGTTKTVPNTAKVTVMKLMGDRIIETTRTANWPDYYPGDGQGAMWRKLPETMLAKVAEAQALRVAFPNCAQLYLSEEMQQAETMPEVSGIDMNKVAEQVSNAQTTDELMSLINGLSIEQQKQIMTLANAKAQELIAKEDSDAAPAAN